MRLLATISGFTGPARRVAAEHAVRSVSAAANRDGVSDILARTAAHPELDRVSPSMVVR